MPFTRPLVSGSALCPLVRSVLSFSCGGLTENEVANIQRFTNAMIRTNRGRVAAGLLKVFTYSCCVLRFEGSKGRAWSTPYSVLIHFVVVAKLLSRQLSPVCLTCDLTLLFGLRLRLMKDPDLLVVVSRIVARGGDWYQRPLGLGFISVVLK